MKPGDIITIAGIRYRVIEVASGPFVRCDRKGVVPGIGFLAVVPL